MRGTIRALAALLALLPGVAPAAGGGTSGAEFLRTAMGARPAAMGETFSGLADDVNAAVWNPAGLGQLNGFQFSAMRMNWIEEISYNYLAGSVPFGDWGSLAVSGIYVGMPSFESTGVAGAVEGTASDMMVAMSWGGSFRNLVPDSPEYHGINYGLTGKFIRRSLGGYIDASGAAQTLAASAFALDVGALWASESGVSGGVVVQNIGSTVTFLGDEADALPFAVRGGIAWRAFDNGTVRATILGDVVKPLDPDGGSMDSAWYGGGLEVSLFGVLALRGGYRLAPEGASVVGGGGLGWGPVAVDFAYAPLGDFGRTMRFGLTVKTGKVETRLPPVGGLAAALNAKKRVELKWEPIPEAVGYQVEVRKPGEDSFGRITKSPYKKSIVPFKGLKAGGEYSFRVFGVDAKSREGRPAELVYVVPGGKPSRPAGSVANLPAPSGLVVSAGEGRVALAWKPVKGAAGYAVYYRKSGGGLRKITPKPLAKTDLSIKLKSAAGLEFLVVALDQLEREGARSPLAAPAGGAAPAASPSAGISAPAGLKAAAAEGRVTVSWGAVPGAAGYNVYYSRGGGGMKKANAAPRTGTSLGIKLKDATGYRFAVSAVDAQGKESPVSSPVPVTQ